MALAVAIGYLVLTVLPELVFRPQLAQRLRARPEPGIPAGLPDSCHLAYLIGGGSRVVFSAIAGLVESGRLRITPDGGLIYTRPVAESATAVELAVVDALHERPGRQAWLVAAGLHDHPAVTAIADALAARRLLVSRSWLAQRCRRVRLCYLAVLLPGVVVMFWLVPAATGWPAGLLGVGLLLAGRGVLTGLSPADPPFTAGGLELRAALADLPAHCTAEAVALRGFAGYPDRDTADLLVRSGTEPAD